MLDYAKGAVHDTYSRILILDVSEKLHTTYLCCRGTVMRPEVSMYNAMRIIIITSLKSDEISSTKILSIKDPHKYEFVTGMAASFVIHINQKDDDVELGD